MYDVCHRMVFGALIRVMAVESVFVSVFVRDRVDLLQERAVDYHLLPNISGAVTRISPTETLLPRRNAVGTVARGVLLTVPRRGKHLCNRDNRFLSVFFRGLLHQWRWRN